VLEDVHATSVDLERRDWDALCELANQRGVTASELIRAAVHSYVKRMQRGNKA
jgi:predicted DNA-binding ribbon-helix-helix protein